jgi:hypothetical protein
MKIFFVIIPAVMCVLSALALIYNKAVAQEVVRKNKSTWGLNLIQLAPEAALFSYCVCGQRFHLHKQSTTTMNITHSIFNEVP